MLLSDTTHMYALGRRLGEGFTTMDQAYPELVDAAELVAAASYSNEKHSALFWFLEGLRNSPMLEAFIYDVLDRLKSVALYLEQNG